MEQIAKQLTEFFEKSENVISNCAQIPSSEREERVTKLQKQLREQDKNIRFLEANHHDKEQVSSLFIFFNFFISLFLTEGKSKLEMQIFVICRKSI